MSSCTNLGKRAIDRAFQCPTQHEHILENKSEKEKGKGRIGVEPIGGNGCLVSKYACRIVNSEDTPSVARTYFDVMEALLSYSHALPPLRRLTTRP